MDHLPDPAVMQKFLSKLSDKEAKDNQLFSDRVDLEEAAKCACTCCPPRDQLEQYDFCCQALFLFPLKKKGQMLRDGLKEKLKAQQSPCITRDPFFTEFLLTDIATEAARALNSYQTGKVDEDQNRAKRHACYRVIIASTMGPLGRGIRIRLPSCVIKAVRNKWPSANYSGFRPSELIDD